MKDNYSRLYTLASSQGGFFTAGQARESGFPLDNTHAYHIKQGHWERFARGIYRLPQIPSGPHDEFFLWLLWSADRQGLIQGVISHESALELYNVSDVNPGKVHLTVPLSFRRSAESPARLSLHKGDLDEANLCDYEGFRVVRLFQTLLDLFREGELSREHIERGYLDGRGRGLISESEALAMRGATEQERECFHGWEKTYGK